jgi:lipoprotein-anchoring transpeptidase ErfK/SrfK
MRGSGPGAGKRMGESSRKRRNGFPPRRVTGRLRKTLRTVPRSYLYVSTTEQRLYRVSGGETVGSFRISTSKYGVGNASGSFQTPPGVHRIASKIGDNAPQGRIFEDRIDTGKTWAPGHYGGKNLVLTRIMRLEGLEEGVNRGPGIDSFDRYIYIHGTNREDSLGTPVSHGCVCMGNDDVVELFNSVPEGTIVVID